MAVYFPVETWASWTDGLYHPYYLVDVIAMGLLLWGAIRSLRARPEKSPAVLAAAYAWTVANGWRATFARAFELLLGGSLDHGPAEMWAVSIATVTALACLILALYLVVRSSPAESE